MVPILEVKRYNSRIPRFTLVDGVASADNLESESLFSADEVEVEVDVEGQYVI